MSEIQNSKGVSIYLTLIILAILLAAVLGVSTILISQIKMIRTGGYSVKAFYAADTGIEEALYKGGEIGSEYSGVLNNGASYLVSIVAPGAEDCPSSANYCLKSIGTFKEIQRAIRVKR